MLVAQKMVSKNAVSESYDAVKSINNIFADKFYPFSNFGIQCYKIHCVRNASFNKR